MHHKAWTFILVALVGILFFAIQVIWWPIGVDYYYTFYPSLEGWSKGYAIYEAQYKTVFYNPPWLLWFITPALWMTFKGGQAALNTFSFFVVLLGWKWFSKSQQGYARPLSLAICIFNLHFFDLLYRAQIDAFVLLGVLFMLTALRRHNPYLLGIGWVLAAVKPTSILLIWPYTLWKAYQGGYWHKAFIVPAMVLVASWLIFDLGWIGRWLQVMRSGGPGPGVWLISLWRIAESLQISSLFAFLIAGIILGATLWALIQFKPALKTTFAFLATTSLLITPYSLSYHYSVLMVGFIPLLLQWRLWLALPLFFLTLTPVLRAFWGVEMAWLDIGFILFAWISMIFYLRETYKQRSIDFANKNTNSLAQLQYQSGEKL